MSGSFSAGTIDVLPQGVLADGFGEFNLNLEIAPLSTMTPLFARRWKVSMNDSLQERWFFMRLMRFSFPERGRYQFTVFADSEWLAQMTLPVISKGDDQ